MFRTLANPDFTDCKLPWRDSPLPGACNRSVGLGRVDGSGNGANAQGEQKEKAVARIRRYDYEIRL